MFAEGTGRIFEQGYRICAAIQFPESAKTTR